MAAEDNFDITISGRGGHAAMPHLSVDPLVIGTHIVSALQGTCGRFFWFLMWAWVWVHKGVGALCVLKIHVIRVLTLKPFSLLSLLSLFLFVPCPPYPPTHNPRRRRVTPGGPPRPLRAQRDTVPCRLRVQRHPRLRHAIRHAIKHIYISVYVPPRYQACH